MIEHRIPRMWPKISIVFGILFLPWTVLANDPKPASSAVTPVPRSNIAAWMKRHKAYVAEASKGETQVLFLGDSITQGWEGQRAWAEYFAPLKASNFGIGGDQTQHVLWRIQHDELKGIHPEVVVLMIGTNNLHANSARQIADGVGAIVHELNTRLPDGNVLLLGIFPRDEKNSAPVRNKIKEINTLIAKLGTDGSRVHYLDIGGKFLDKDGNLSREIMPDFLHLSPKGYMIWAEAIKPTVEELLKK
jgi:lysophospholipase L1-like esterase